MAKYTDKQLITIGLNVSIFLKVAKKTQQEFANEMGKTRQTVNAWINGRGITQGALESIAMLCSRWIGVTIRPNEFLIEEFAETLTSGLSGNEIEHDPSYTRTTLSIEEYISKNKLGENLDEYDETYLLDLYSRGSKLDKVSEKSIRNMLRAFRENFKDQWISGKK
ncbi:MAG: helix-turn-helix transcriptional regulator [Candidatus Marinimicrobia bacterium]|nr:helix-turn-helix transcriptional regulator [Candidatus Neomarinimicrobiota bacterium]